MSERKRRRSVVRIGAGGIERPKQCGTDRSPVSADRQGAGAALSPSHLHQPFTLGHSASMTPRVISDSYRFLSPRRRSIYPGIDPPTDDVIAEGASGAREIKRDLGNELEEPLRSLPPPAAYQRGA